MNLVSTSSTADSSALDFYMQDQFSLKTVIRYFDFYIHDQSSD